MTPFSTRRKASVGKSPLSGMPPAKETTSPSSVAGTPAPRRRSSSAPMICALREKSPDQSMEAAARTGATAATSGRPVTKVPCPTWARTSPAATSSS